MKKSHTFSLKNIRAISIIASLFIKVDFINAQTILPKDVSRFPESLGPMADAGFYNGCSPMYSSINWKNETNGTKHIFILTLSRITDNPGANQEGVVYPTQAVLLSADSSGVFPRWQFNFEDEKSTRLLKNFGIFRYYPEYGIYTIMKQDSLLQDVGTLLILDSTFHQIDLIPQVIFNTHDFQLLKMPNGHWEIVTAWPVPPKYFDSLDWNYEIISMEYDHNIFKKQLWKCGPTTATVDSAEWYHICNHCDANPNMISRFPTGYNSQHDMFHANTLQSYSWSKDSILVAVGEKNDDKIRFWWVVDSSGAWITRGMFRLGSHDDPYNNFLLPDNPDFQISRGHDFKMLGRYKNSLIATYYDNELCNANISARGLVLYLDIEKKICKILEQSTQDCRSFGAGSFQLMLDKTGSITPDETLQANRCIDWGIFQPPASDLQRSCWEISVLNSNNQPIINLTVTDLGYNNSFNQMVNADYQAQAWYHLPIPSRPVSYVIKGHSVILTTKLVHPTWITGATTPSITLPMPAKNKPITMWVRGKTDETMVGELWEKIILPTK